MPTYQDIDGSRYWFDEVPEPGTIRASLVLVADAVQEIEPVPQSATPWQIRKALNALSLRASVEAAVAAQDQDTRDGWEFATEFRRDDPLLNAMAPALGIDLDAVFRLAVTL